MLRAARQHQLQAECDKMKHRRLWESFNAWQFLCKCLVFEIKRKKSNQFSSMSESTQNWINNFDAPIRTQLEIEFYFFFIQGSVFWSAKSKSRVYSHYTETGTLILHNVVFNVKSEFAIYFDQEDVFFEL